MLDFVYPPTHRPAGHPPPEVQRELPEQATLFQSLDLKVRDTLAETWEARVVMSGCTQNGLVARLDEIVQVGGVAVVGAWSRGCGCGCGCECGCGSCAGIAE